MRAYALMQRSQHLEAEYVRRAPYPAAVVEAIRAVLPGVGAVQYRGVGRYPLTEYPQKGPGWEGDSEAPLDPEPDARALLLKALGPYDYQTQYPRAFLMQFDQAKAVYDALSEKWRYEIVEICSAPELPGDLLGFDVGYWGGGNFSILSDAVFWPIWHPPHSAALTELARAVHELNEHALFPTERSARAYLDWYRTQPWAEKEPTDFTIMTVGSVPPVP